MTAILPPPPDPIWDLRPPPTDAVVSEIADVLSLPRPLCALLVVRGIVEPDAIRRYLRPRLEYLHPPEALPDAAAATDRILGAIDRGETIFVHGDYDVDGISATALLTRWLRHLGGRVEPFVPHRTRDGYDLGPAGVAAARAAGASLLITCDCGIRAHDAVESAREAGIDVIVTDHHLPAERLPPALAVVNPARADSAYPGEGLCGAGVAWQLCRLLATRRGVPEDDLRPLLAFVALATIADLVPLRGENRVLARFGLRYLSHTSIVGLRALLDATGIEGDVKEGQVAFGLAPRINAAGRVADASTALRLLLTDDPDEARKLARELDEANDARRGEEARTLGEVLELLARSYDPARDFGVVVAGEGWHPGVIGIVAARVVERIHRPVVLIAIEGGRARGSGRSIPGVHLHDVVAGCSGHLARYGGHRQAIGMDLESSSVDGFRETFSAAVREALGGRPPRPTLGAELELPISAADEEMARILEYMAPFGIGNRRPLFRASDVGVDASARIVGNGHLKLRFRAGASALDAIGFGLGERHPPEGLAGGRVDVLFELEMNEFRGRVTPQARLRDLRPTRTGTIAAPPGEERGDGDRDVA